MHRHRLKSPTKARLTILPSVANAPNPDSGKGFVNGNRTDHLNKEVFKAEMRGQTDHSEVIEKARRGGLAR